MAENVDGPTRNGSAESPRGVWATEHGASFVLEQSIKGATYNVAVSGATIVLGFARSVLLMRLLSPREFGFASLALFFVTFLAPFSTLGIDSALVQRRSPEEQTFSTHFTLRLLLAVAVLLLGFLVSPLLRRVYADQAIVIDIFVVLLSANVLSASFSTPGAMLRRELRFGVLAVLNLLSSVAMTISAPLAAYWGAGVWSLVVEQVAGHVVRWFGLWIVLRPWRLCLRFDWREAKYLIGFGWHVFSSHISGILLDRFDDFWIGTALGSVSLGYYSRAYELAQYPERVLATPITHVVLPSYAALQNDREDLSKLFFHTSGFLVRAGFLLAAVLFTVSTEVTVIAFGEAWLPMVPLFRLMLAYVLLNPLYQNLSYLVVAVGQPDLLSRTRWLQVVTFALSTIGFARLWRARGVAVAADLMILGGTAVLLAFSFRYVDYSLRRMFLWPGVATVAAVVLGFSLGRCVQIAGPWGPLLLKSLCVSLAYMSVLLLLERRAVWEQIREITGLVSSPKR